MDGQKIHITPVKHYMAIAVLLLILTVVTVAVSFIDSSNISNAVLEPQSSILKIPTALSSSLVNKEWPIQ